MVREVSSPQPKLLSLTDPTHPALSQQPTCGTQPLLHGRGRGLDGAPLGRVPPPFPAEPPSETLAPPPALLPSAPTGPPHSLTRTPGHGPWEAPGEAGQGSGAGWALPQQGALCPSGEGARLARGGVENPRSGRGPKSASRTAAEAGPPVSPLTAAPALRRPPRPAPGVLELVPPRPWAG